MKVPELIEELKKCNPKQEVLICLPSTGYKEIRKVINPHPPRNDGYVLLWGLPKEWGKNEKNTK
jgi:hypothetical protein